MTGHRKFSELHHKIDDLSLRERALLRWRYRRDRLGQRWDRFVCRVRGHRWKMKCCARCGEPRPGAGVTMSVWYNERHG